MGGEMGPGALEAKTDRELLLLTAADVGHVKEHMKRLDGKVGVQNGRITALEKWRWGLAGAMALGAPLAPLLIYEVRQSVFGAFGG